MNTSMLNNLSDAEFLRMYRDSGQTDLEKMLFDRLSAMSEDLESCREEVRACGPQEDEMFLRDYDFDELAEEINDRLSCNDKALRDTRLADLVANISGIQLVAANAS